MQVSRLFADSFFSIRLSLFPFSFHFGIPAIHAPWIQHWRLTCSLIYFFWCVKSTVLRSHLVKRHMLCRSTWYTGSSSASWNPMALIVITKGLLLGSTSLHFGSFGSIWSRRSLYLGWNGLFCRCLVVLLFPLLILVRSWLNLSYSNIAAKPAPQSNLTRPAQTWLAALEYCASWSHSVSSSFCAFWESQNPSSEWLPLSWNQRRLSLKPRSAAFLFDVMWSERLCCAILWLDNDGWLCAGNWMNGSTSHYTSGFLGLLVFWPCQCTCSHVVSGVSKVQLIRPNFLTFLIQEALQLMSDFFNFPFIWEYAHDSLSFSGNRTQGRIMHCVCTSSAQYFALLVLVRTFNCVGKTLGISLAVKFSESRMWYVQEIFLQTIIQSVWVCLKISLVKNSLLCESLWAVVLYLFDACCCVPVRNSHRWIARYLLFYK